LQKRPKIIRLYRLKCRESVSRGRERRERETIEGESRERETVEGETIERESV